CAAHELCHDFGTHLWVPPRAWGFLWGWAPPFSLTLLPNWENPHMKFSRGRKAEGDEGHPVWTSPTQSYPLDPGWNLPISDHLPKHLSSWKASAERSEEQSREPRAVSVQAELPVSLHKGILHSSHCSALPTVTGAGKSRIIPGRLCRNFLKELEEQRDFFFQLILMQILNSLIPAGISGV
ncbi:hypothetical protein Nmel_018033, partial [Mimus melanotis]